MRILVISDSHGCVSKLEEILDKNNSAKDVIFLGDGMRDIQKIESLYSDRKFHMVCGNCDFCGGSDEKFEEFSEKKIFFTHGHKYAVKYDYDFQTIREKGKDMKADIVLFGHTHQPFEDYRDCIYFMNPGSVGDGRYGLINIQNGSVLCSLGRL